MKTLYLECNMGAAGDMLTAALSDLLEDKEAFVAKMNGLGIEGLSFSLEPRVKMGVTGNHATVKVHGDEEDWHDSGEEEHEHHHHDHEEEHEHHHHDHDHEHHHHHTSVADINGMIEKLPVSEKVKHDAKAVYHEIAEAESAVHGRPVEQIHFHEVGTMDALADVTAVCLLMEELAVDQVIVSPIHVGSGQVRCAHGILPVPAPATAHILKGVPTYGGEIRGELCTPTGAALLKYFAASFGPRPVMKVEKVGYGMGNRDFPVMNCVRAYLGETEDGGLEKITELSCNIDDMTGEALGGLYETLTAAGALDVALIPAVMKKNRPGHLLLCIVKPEKADAVAEAILQNTATIGVRRNDIVRYVLDREQGALETAYGQIRYKRSFGYGADKVKPEWEDLASAAKAAGVSTSKVREAFYKEFNKD